ncbi:MAG: DUF4249 family protein [Prevotella sp.]|nr:DUF4249 family protein [Prevotella sp.]
MKKTLIIFLTALSMTACEKEIDLDYHEVAPLYAAEATVTQEGTNVWLRTTQSVTDNSAAGHGVAGANIVLSELMPSGELFPVATLTYKKDGQYTASATGIPGITYVIDIAIDGQHYTSQSTMPNAPTVNSFRFVWKKVLSERMLFADLRLQDERDKANYYFAHIYRNGVGYRWAVMTDQNNPNGELQQLFQCTTERDMNKNDEDALSDNDVIRVEIRSIDRQSYDYLYSMQVMDNAGTNPIQNYSGGQLLGYFSAYSFVTLNQRFQRAAVEEE